MQKSKATILCTRLLTETLLQKAADKGITIELSSFIETKNIENNKIAKHLQSLSLRPIVAVFTSINAASAVAENLASVPAWKICCTGGVTKEYIIKFFGENSIIASAKNARALADKMIVTETAQPIVFFCGDQRLNDLPETLAKHGKKAAEIIVYTTMQTPVFIEKSYDGFLFFSPSAVHSFFSLNTVSTNAILFSIGKTTTAAIQSYCSNRIITSEWPGAESMIEMVADYYG